MIQIEPGELYFKTHAKGALFNKIYEPFLYGGISPYGNTDLQMLHTLIALTECYI